MEPIVKTLFSQTSGADDYGVSVEAFRVTADQIDIHILEARAWDETTEEGYHNPYHKVEALPYESNWNVVRQAIDIFDDLVKRHPRLK